MVSKKMLESVENSGFLPPKFPLNRISIKNNYNYF